jgi:hypothetical protein
VRDGDIEKGRKLVSSERAAAWAKILGYPDTVFVKLALQEQLDKAGVKGLHCPRGLLFSLCFGQLVQPMVDETACQEFSAASPRL